MTQEELKDFILSRIKLNEVFWKPKIEDFFKVTPNVTRETMDAFFEESLQNLRKEAEIFDKKYFEKRSNHLRSDYEYERYDDARRKEGLIPLEEAASARYEVEMAFDEIELTEFQAEMASFADQFRKKAEVAFNNNDRYACAIFYTLYAVALNKELKDIYIKRFLMARVFTPSPKVTTELSLDESQQKEVVDCILDMSRYDSIGPILLSLDLSQVERNNFPFKPCGQDFSFFDFILICKMKDIIPVVKEYVSDQKPHLNKYQLHRHYNRQK